MKNKKVICGSIFILILISLFSAAYSKTNIVLMMPPILAASKDKDRAPDSFSFTQKSNVALGTFVTSDTITVSGINDSTLIYIIGGVYSIDGGAFTGGPDQVADGQKVQVGLTSASNYSTSTTAILYIGGVSAGFTVRTMNDTTPNSFSFFDQMYVDLNTVITSTPIIVSGITGPTPISISKGSYSIDGAAFTNTSSSVTNGQSVRVQLVSANTYSTSKDATLTIGGITDTFTVRTIGDTTPDKFTFIDKANVKLNTVITSNTITVAGISEPVPIYIIGGSYSINNGPFTGLSGTIANGQNVKVRLMSSGVFSTSTDATLAIGTTSDTFTVTTIADTTPNGFFFTDQANVALNTVITSDPIFVSGITTAVPISITGGTYSVNGGPFSSAPRTITNSQNVRVQLLSSSNYLTSKSATLTIGGVRDTFTVTTKARTYAYWGVENNVCCTISSATFTATLEGVTKSSTLASCYSSPSWGGWATATPGPKTFVGGWFSSGCGSGTSSLPFTLLNGLYHLFVLGFNGSNFTITVYVGTLNNSANSSVVTNEFVQNEINYDSWKCVDEIVYDISDYNTELPMGILKATN